MHDLVPPVYSKLKDLHINTLLVNDGRPNVTIIAPASGIYERQARRTQDHIEALTGVRVPIEADESAAGSVPVTGNLIVLGNRSTSKTISELYNRYYTLLDLRYPGQGGCVVRTVHNPFGNGKNIVLIGGSDTEGVQAATEAFVQELDRSEFTANTLSIGRIANISLGEGISVPEELAEFEIWEASAGYGSVGYFGWNSISKRMAMYYMTGDEFHAREFIRLAFPDEKAMQEIAEIDGVAPDEWVAYEYATVRRLYTVLGIPERTRIEFFNGGHQINAQGTFDFLHRWLSWPKRKFNRVED